MENKLQALIEEVKSNINNTEDQIQEYVKTIDELSKAFPYEHPEYGEQFLKCGYYPYSWEGKKVVLDTMGVGDAPTERMVRDLISKGKLEAFIEFYTKVALPLHASGNCREKFLF